MTATNKITTKRLKRAARKAGQPLRTFAKEKATAPLHALHGVAKLWCRNKGIKLK